MAKNVAVKKSEEREIKKFLSRLQEYRKDASVNARLGNRYTGELKIGNKFYATLESTGQVVRVVNNVAPSKFRWPVKIGYAPNSRILQVLETWNVYDEMTQPDLPAHSQTQQWPEPDTLFVRAEQVLPGLFIPNTGLILSAYAFVYFLDGLFHLLPNQDIDLSSEVPGSGANYVLLEVDEDRNLQFTAGATVDTRQLLRAEDIPTPSTGYYPLVAVKMYEGQTSFIQSLEDSDITDLRWAGFAGGGGGLSPSGWTTARILYTDASGDIVVSDDLSFNVIDGGGSIGDNGSNSPPIMWVADPSGNPTGFILVNVNGSIGVQYKGISTEGTPTSPTPVSAGKKLVSLRGAGYDGVGSIRDAVSSGAFILIANENFDSTHHGTYAAIFITPDGSTTIESVPSFIFQSDGNLNLKATKKYLVDGAQHTHDGENVNIDASGFSGNLDGSVTDVQLLADAVDTLAASGGGGDFASAGRISLASATPVITTEQANKTMLYYTPFRGNKVTFLDGTTLSFSELSLNMSAWDKNCLHDIFRYNNSGAVAIEGLSWGISTAYNITAASAADPVVITFTAAVGTNPFSVNDIIGIQDITGNIGSDVLQKNIWQVTAIGGSNPNWTVTLLGVSTSGKTYTSGGTIRKINQTRATNIVFSDGIYIKNADPTRVYLGSVFIDGNGYCQDTIAISSVWNYYNRVSKSLKQSEATASWTKSTATITPANNNANNRITLIVGIPEDAIWVDLLASVIPGTTATYGYAGIGEDTMTNFTSKTMGGGGGATSAWFVFSSFLRKVPTAGIHFYSWNERSTSTNTSTFYGEGSVGGILESGLDAVIQG